MMYNELIKKRHIIILLHMNYTSTVAAMVGAASSQGLNKLNTDINFSCDIF